MSEGGSFTRLRYKYFPDNVVGEILAKPWIDNAIPFIALVVVIATFGSITPHFFALSSLSDLGREIAEFGLVVLGLAIVVLSGGIDLSVGAVFSLGVLCALLGVNVLGWPIPAVFVATIALGAVCGALNGYLVGYLRLRAFLTTLVTLIIFRSVYELVSCTTRRHWSPATRIPTSGTSSARAPWWASLVPWFWRSSSRSSGTLCSPACGRAGD